MQRQGSFSQAEYAGKKKQTRRDKFLAEMEQVVPWARLVERLPRSIRRASAAGRRSVWSGCCGSTFCSSGTGWPMERWRMRSTTAKRLRGFAGIDLTVAAVPEETTILNFRHWLERHELSQGVVRRSIGDAGGARPADAARHDRRCDDHRRAALDQEQAEEPRPGDAPDQEGQSVMEWMPLLTASRCAKVVMFSHPTNGEGIHGKG